MIRKGMYDEARLLMIFLRKGRILLGRDPVSWNVGIFLSSDTSCTIRENRNGSMIIKLQ